MEVKTAEQASANVLKDIAALTPSFLDRVDQSRKARKDEIERQALAMVEASKGGSEETAAGTDTQLAPSLKERVDVLIRAIGVANSWPPVDTDARIENGPTGPWIST